jgi:mono/diheme cytochrome c family protein
MGLGVAWLMTPSLASAADASKEAKPVDVSKLPAASTNQVTFAKDIQPILKKSCLDCHGEDVQMGGYRLDKREFAVKGGDRGVAIIPGKSEKSPLIHYVAGLVKGLEMPPDASDALKKESIALLRAWIDQGAKW